MYDTYAIINKRLSYISQLPERSIATDVDCEIDTLQTELTDFHVNKVKIYNYIIAFYACFNVCNINAKNNYLY